MRRGVVFFTPLNPKEKIKYKGDEGIEVKFPVIADLKMDVAKEQLDLPPMWAGDKDDKDDDQ